ncbi:MAG: D-sedoheptulose 7-phosphate isomerase [Bacteroidota bacterium]
MTSIEAEIAAHSALVQKLQPLLPTIEQACSIALRTLQSGNRLFFIGNGGSAADAQHLAAELVGRFRKERNALPAIALTTDTSILTAVANDYGFEHIFDRQIKALAKPGDLLIAISTSGNSPNVLQALQTARTTHLQTIGLSGKDGGKMKDHCDVCLVIPSDDTARIQEMHILIGHILCSYIETHVDSIA